MVHVLDNKIKCAELQGIHVIDMKCYRKMLCISYKDHVTNEEVSAKIQQAIRPHENLLTTINRHKLLSGMDCLPFIWSCKGTANRGRRQGRQKKRWEDNIREWAGLEYTKSQRAVKNREKWKKLVVQSSVVP